MNVLAIDTASPDASVALAVGGRIFEEALPFERRASEELLPALRRVIEAAGVALADCERIAVCAGPGSFTGVRVGLSTAWGLSRAAGIPIETVSTLEALAETERGRAQRVLAALEAGRGELVCGEYALPANARAAASGDSVRVSPERARELASARGAALVALPAGLAGDHPAARRPRPAAALALAVAAWPGETSSSLAAIYSRPSAAEEKRGVAP
ncbi:MAG TPA: tRNA (adenosine(37)-N6)-threonylcarbamoyltransferase complex dimerization subunit type 1 TsaB [Thermoanaerobaculia bacterium]|jgi:tRNA threonylcarbamoyladenosine biosynthesis protein TsaB|nr:tRNA (adenosine(37)-N6)-threonylcarbamoyltransferase complex dimerization subunit type 1 TsaB [Thermoanaerobaculia bacterium]